MEKTNRSKKLSIVIPAHNEEKRIGKTLESYCRFYSDLKKQNKKEKKKQEEKKIDFEIIVVLNACRDDTIGVVKKAERKCKEVRHLEFREGGKGFAIIQGFKVALKNRADMIGFVDADLATSPEAFYELVGNINAYDGIIGSRWKKESIIKTKQTVLRIVAGRVFNFLVRSFFLMPYRDSQCGCKLFKRGAIENIVDKLGITKWAFDVDLLYKLRKKGYRIREIPTIWEDKKESKLDAFRVSIQMFSAIVRLRLLYSPLSFIIRLYDKLPEKIKFHHGF